MNSQTDLFGSALPAPKLSDARPAASGKAVEPAPVSDALLSIARQLPAPIHLGTSSWSFPGWRGLVYANQSYTESKLAKDGLAAYAVHPLLRTVSLDRTFYAPLTEAEFATYAKNVPAHFRFIVKAPQAITMSYTRDEAGNFSDSPYFLDIDYATDHFIAPCSNGLSAKLGCMVLQFPPLGKRVTGAPDAFINRLYRFLRALPPGLPYAVEIRDPELLTTRFFMCLQSTQTSFCVASHARMPSPCGQLAAQSRTVPQEEQYGPLIVRWSLHAGLKYEDAKTRYFPFDRLVDPDLDTRAALAEAAVAALRRGRPSFIAINNKAEGCSPKSVEALAALINEKLST